MMKKPHLLFIVLLAFSHSVLAAADEDKTPKADTQAGQTNQAPQMSEIPKMKEQGKRMAELMQKIQDVKDPAERKRMLAEATCPQ